MYNIEQEGDSYAIVTDPMHKGDWRNTANWNSYCNGTEVHEILWIYIIIDAAETLKTCNITSHN